MFIIKEFTTWANNFPVFPLVLAKFSNSLCFPERELFWYLGKAGKLYHKVIYDIAVLKPSPGGRCACR